MAEPSSSALNQLLECAICLSPVRNHRVLPCQHSFCQSCLEPLVKKHKVVCPICRRICALDGAGVAALPRNVMLIAIIEQTCEKCRMRPKELQCRHCQKYLCKICQKECKDEVSEIRRQLITATKNALALAYQTIQEVNQKIGDVQNRVTEVSVQIDQTTQKAIDDILARHHLLKHELVSDAAKATRQLTSQNRELVDHVKDLNSYGGESSLEDEGDLGDVARSYTEWKSKLGATRELCLKKHEVIIECKGEARQDSSNNLKYDEISRLQSVEVSNASSQTVDYHSKGKPLSMIKSIDPKTKQQCPSHIALSPTSGNIFLCDRQNNRIQVYSKAGQLLCQFGSTGRQCGMFSFGGLACAGGLAVTKTGMIIVADTGNHRIQIFLENGEFVRTFGKQGSDCGHLLYPRGLCCDEYGDIYVCDAGNHRIQVLKQNGSVVRVFGIDEADDWTPLGIGVFKNGDIGVVHSVRYDGRIEIFSPQGYHKITIRPADLQKPSDITIDNQGNMIVTDYTKDEVDVVSVNGDIICSLCKSGVKAGELDGPVGVALSPDGVLFVVDRGNNRVQLF